MGNLFEYNPLGEISEGDFFMRHTSLGDAKLRAHSCFAQVVVNVILIAVFTQNTWQAAKLVYLKHTSVASWCCILQALLGLATAVVNITTAFPEGLSCRITIWMASVGIVISNICVNTCLLLKAYVIADRNRFLLAIGSFITLLNPGIVWIVFVDSPVQNTVDSACSVDFPPYFPWFRFVLDISSNSIFSAVFLHVVIKQYRQQGKKCWQKLKSDGLIYLFGVVFSNIFCALLVASQLAGKLGNMFILIDWMLTSFLLIRQHEGMRRAFSEHDGASHYKQIHVIHQERQ
ncbi:hypothetical protein BDF19DRAFT_424392 [Syncephalis fuscata]|nr:hypothetical protein BDF19DRAFT_424392 [Syncephalis fuscata]